MYLVLLAVTAFGDDVVLPPADLVIAGEVVSTGIPELRHVWELARTLDGRLALPDGAKPWVCVKVDEVLAGDLFGDETCFYLANDALAAHPTAATGEHAVWLLRDAEIGGFPYVAVREGWQPAERHDVVKLLVADASRKPAELPSVDGAPADWEVQLKSGTASQKLAVLAAYRQGGYLSMTAAVIEAIRDKSPVKPEGSVVAHQLGIDAAATLTAVAPRVDGLPARPAGFHAFGKDGLDYDLRAAAVHDDWLAWWGEWNKDGPPSAHDPD
jgi:hypothetical protein